MKKTLVSLAVIGSFALAACSHSDKNDNAAASAASAANAAACQNPAYTTAIQTQFKQALATAQQQALRSSNGEYIDAQKLADLDKQIGISLTESGATASGCQARISISIPKTLLEQAEHYAPLLQSGKPADSIAQKLVGSNIQFNGETLTIPFNFTANGDNINGNSQTLSQVAQILTDVLLPAFVKGKLEIDGKTLSRDQALKLVLNPPKPEAASEPAAKAEPVEVPTISENTDENSSDNDTPPAAPQKLTPPDSGNSKSRISRQDLNDAIDAHNQANDSIRSAWRNIDPTIQQDLVDEQRDWERRKATSCGNAAAKGNSAVESQYLRMQCDTRLTRERVQYLKGFSIE